MTTPTRYLAAYRPGDTTTVDSLATFLEAVVHGADLWNGNPNAQVHWSTDNAESEYKALKALGWSAGADYGSYGMEDLFVYSPHPQPTPVEKEPDEESYEG